MFLFDLGMGKNGEHPQNKPNVSTLFIISCFCIKQFVLNDDDDINDSKEQNNNKYT